ncbi:MAG: 5'-methylthioadenosine/adenosylhomocysteine nucleosidase [Firmicutes bacterium]|nr:5'-methylthioadenosine/adenosylhomocysteine nucleosidase [Bacillota bacterium]
MIGIIGAMEIEVSSIKSLLTDTVEQEISGIQFMSGKYNNKDIVVAKCGVGKVFAAMCAEAMILKYSPETIINIGVAGCLDNSLKIGDIVIADSVVQYDMDTSALGDPKGFLSGINIVKIPSDEEIVKKLQSAVDQAGIRNVMGTIASGDKFVNDSATKRFIISEFGGKACEMEGASIGHVCYVNKVPFGVLRAMSDGADETSHMDFEEFTALAAQNSTAVLKNFLNI